MALGQCAALPCGRRGKSWLISLLLPVAVMVHVIIGVREEREGISTQLIFIFARISGGV
jgi:hypothetical protein